MLTKTLLIAVIVFCQPTLANISNPHRFGPLPNDVHRSVNMSVCHVMMPSQGNSFPCNPAMLPFFKDRQFVANAMIGEHFEIANEYREDI
jgi:hypothetical protein